MKAVSPSSIRILSTCASSRVWPLEVHDFNAWLARSQGTRMLADALGCDLQYSSSEEAAAGGRSDLIFEMLDPASGRPCGRRLVVESFLRQADGDHFARLLQYAAALDCERVVAALIAPSFAEGLLATISRLNRALDPDRMSICAVGIEVSQPHRRMATALTTLVGGVLMPGSGRGRLAGMAAALARADAAGREAGRSIWLDGLSVQVSSCLPDIRFALAPADEEGWQLSCLLCCASDVQANNILRASAAAADDLRGRAGAEWSPQWLDSDPAQMARISGPMAATGTDAAAAAAVRLFAACNEHLSSLDRHFYQLRRRR